MKKHIAFYFIYPLFFSISILLFLFYLDLANGPFILFPISLVVLIGYMVVRMIFRNKKFTFKLLLFVGLILSIIVILLFDHPETKLFSPVDKVSYTDVVEVNEGKLVGTYNNDNSVKIYTGIPYAKAPVGNLRWREPQDLDNYEGILDCTSFKAKAMQLENSSVINTLVDMYAEKVWHPDYHSNPFEEISEDCLYLNIWAPNTTSKNLPVLVYIHGGSLKSGSSSFYSYNGENMAKKGIIMITIAYRLGIFGFYASNALKAESPNNSTGNYGLLDQIQALKWINNNIEAFGGDKTNITIAGESAGSSCISALCTSPLTVGLFQKAIGESSSLAINNPPHTFRTFEKAISDNQGVMGYLGCSSIDEMRALNAETIIKASEHFNNSSMTVDGYALTKTPYESYKNGENHEVALLNGSNVLEADAFVVPSFLFSKTKLDNIENRLTNYLGDKETAKKILALYNLKTDNDAFLALNEIMSVIWFIYPHYSWSYLAYNNGTTVYRYSFTKENGYYGSYHSGELIYAYNNISRDTTTYRYDNSDQELSNIMSSYWVNFVKYGNPNAMELPIWNKWTPSQNRVQELGKNVSEINDRFEFLYQILDEYFNNQY